MAKVLIVEDEASIREMIALNLHLAGMEALEAESAEQALTLLEQQPDCDAAILDVMLPGMERLFALRNHPPHGSEDRHHHPQCQRAGTG